MKNHINSFSQGISDGLPICFGYFSVAFAFGIFSTGSGLSILETLFISMTNVTSAGQLAAVPIIAAGGSVFELALTQFVINLRYSLMSISLSQRVGSTVKTLDRLLIAFVNTDEVFAVAASKDSILEKKYLYGLIITPYLGWSGGTFIGAVAGNILPSIVVSALGIAIYAMFIAIIIPPAKKSRATALCILLAVGLSCMFNFIPLLNKIPSGFVIIICAIAASAVLALIAPIQDEGEAEDNA